MPEFLSPESARFELTDGTPLLRLAVPAPPSVEGWSIMNRLTMCVVDGPGNAGYLLPRFASHGDLAPNGWDEAVQRSGGAMVAFGDAEPVHVPNAVA